MLVTLKRGIDHLAEVGTFSPPNLAQMPRLTMPHTH